MKPRIALVGYGYWGPNLTRNFIENPECELAMICDKNTQRLAQVRKKYPQLQITENFQVVLNDPTIDAVIIATPVSTHFGLVEAALKKNKHVLVEKPLATSVVEAKKLAALSKKTKRVLMTGHTFLYSPPVRKVKEILKQKQLGKVFTMDFSRVNLGLFQPDVNVIWDLAPHDVSIALYWLGTKPKTVQASAKSFVRKKIEEVGYLTLEFPGNIWVHHHFSWIAPVKLRRVTIVGSKQMLVYDDTQNTEKVKLYNQGVLTNPTSFGEFQLTYRSGEISSPKIDATEPLSLECSDFITSIQKQKNPVSNADFAVEVVRILEAAQTSLAKNGIPIRI
jgi:predicted dehydrogenase